MDNVSVLVGTCDSYSHLWKNFFILFERYWKVETPVYFVGENKHLLYHNYYSITPGDWPWGYRMLEGLKHVKTEYVVFLLEDYYLTEEITEKDIQYHIDIMKEYNADKIMLEVLDDEYSLNHVKNNLYKFNNNSNYLNSVQPSIWRTDYLREVLKPEYSPWDFELVGNYHTSTLNPTILLKARDKRIYFNYARVGGKISEGWEELFKKENLS